MALDNTKDRIVHATSELFREQGYNATSVKQIVNQAEAQLGSVYHYFPLGKQELGAEAIRVSGALYEQLIPAVFDAAPDVVTGVRDFFDGAGEHLVQTGYADACPIATVALEVSSTSQQMRIACAEVFERWIEAGSVRFREAGVTPTTARELTIAMLCALEGAFVLARASRTTEPLRVAGEMTALAVDRALADA
jgi:AcrR family transcriptional regulator